MQTQMYLIEPFTNMHVGSGKENSGIVDNTVQRDVLTRHPVINSTSLKGALKEYCKNSTDYNDGDVTHIFGAGNGKENGIEREEGNKNIPGKFNFFNANLLSIPARSDKFSYLNATTPFILSELLSQIDLLGKDIILTNEYNAIQKLADFDCNCDAFCFIPQLEEAVVGSYKVKACYRNGDKLFTDNEIKILQSWLGNNFVLLKKEVFEKHIINDNKLPVIARNHLNDGQSTNLWYEEIVPRKTRFYTFIAAKEWKNSANKEYNFVINSIQIGANATVGYGYSRIFKPNTQED
jgi:CRISPR-associated protein Cmr4